MIPVSVCMIVKNEEKRLERCLKSLAGYGFEIIIVDTGSTDRTKEVALQYSAKVFDFPWINDFSAARNFSIRQASNNWIFMMDSDEWVESIDLEELDYFRKNLSHAVGSVTRRNLVGTPEHPTCSIDRTERFFSKKRYYYTGNIHEQLTPKFEKNFENFLLNTTIGHDGYCMSFTQQQEKAHRNISMLLEWLEKEPENPYIYYQLGKGYDIISDYEKACEYYRQGLDFPLDNSLAYVLAMVIAYGQDLLALGRINEAMCLQSIYEDFSYSADFVYLMGLIYEAAGELLKAAREFEKAAAFEFSNQEGANGSLALSHLKNVLSKLEKQLQQE